MSASDSPLVTVVTPSYNQGPFIRDAIESVLAQNYPRIEYLVMDGGSTDGSLEILRSYGDRVRWISRSDAGQSDAIRRGFARGAGEILAWLNADDQYTPGAVSRAVSALTARPDAGLVYGNADFVDREGRRYGHQMRRAWSFEYLLSRRNFISQPATFFRRSAYEAVGGIDPDLHFVMDYDLWLKLGGRFPVCAVPEVLALVRIYRETKTNSGGLDRVEEIRRMVARHGRTRLPEWHYWDLLRESTRAAIAAAREGRPADAARRMARTAPYLLHPMVLHSIARHLRWRAGSIVRRALPAPRDRSP